MTVSFYSWTLVLANLTQTQVTVIKNSKSFSAGALLRHTGVNGNQLQCPTLL